MKRRFTIISKACNGFTIIEVLVVISILGLIMGVGSVRFRDFQRRQEVLAAKRTILTDVRQAQSDAGSGIKPSGCTESLLGYGFEVTSGATYEIFARCQNGAGTNDFVVKSVTVTNGLQLSTPSVNPVIFRPLQLGTTITAGGSITVNITSTKTTNTESLVISSSGEIR